MVRPHSLLPADVKKNPYALQLQVRGVQRKGEANVKVVTLWGRANSANVIKVIWALLEVRAAFERVDAGLEFGMVDTPEFLRMNPNGLVPLLKDGPYLLWESNTILRYIARSSVDIDEFYSRDPYLSSAIDQWLDWQQSCVSRPLGLLFVELVRKKRSTSSQEVRDLLHECSAVAAILDENLAERPFVACERPTLADFALAPFFRRYLVLIGRAASEDAHGPILRWLRLLSRRNAFLLAIGEDALPHPPWLVEVHP